MKAATESDTHFSLFSKKEKRKTGIHMGLALRRFSPKYMVCTKDQ